MAAFVFHNEILDQPNSQQEEEDHDEVNNNSLEPNVIAVNLPEEAIESVVWVEFALHDAEHVEVVLLNEVIQIYARADGARNIRPLNQGNALEIPLEEFELQLAAATALASAFEFLIDQSSQFEVAEDVTLGMELELGKRFAFDNLRTIARQFRIWLNPKVLYFGQQRLRRAGKFDTLKPRVLAVEVHSLALALGLSNVARRLLEKNLLIRLGSDRTVLA
mmetsp:Transcript_29381/g.44379  ORF Transcript_29381/g.44379 Transcript_29381/m.44379 type:complete len:220 (-) Transcript_29381:460-1119(-)